MTAIKDLTCLAVQYLADFPFDHELTANSIESLRANALVPITGFCSGSVIEQDSIPKIFFRAGFDNITSPKVENEYDILSKLQVYDFVPRILCFKEMGRYKVLFIGVIDGISLDILTDAHPQFEYALKEGLKLVHRLYCELGFLHKDLHPGNIMLDHKSKVYLIDFTQSIIPSQRVSWVLDLSIFVNSLDNFDNRIDQLEEFVDKLDQLPKSIDFTLYAKYINHLEHILFD